MICTRYRCTSYYLGFEIRSLSIFGLAYPLLAHYIILYNLPDDPKHKRAGPDNCLSEKAASRGSMPDRVYMPPGCSGSEVVCKCARTIQEGAKLT
jgi:hypothetical protein